MAGVLRWLERAVERLSLGCAYVSVLSLLVLSAVVTYGVTMRYVFNDAQNWTDEVATYSLLFLVFLSLAHTLHHGGHIRIDFVVGLLPRRAQLYLQIVADLIGVFFTVLLFLACLNAFMNFIARNTHSISGLDLPLYVPASALLVGSTLLILTMVANTVRDIASAFEP